MTYKQLSLEDALRRAYYYTETGAWKGPLTLESDRWHAVSMVAMDHALEMVRAALAEAQAEPQPVEVREALNKQSV